MVAVIPIHKSAHAVLCIEEISGLRYRISILSAILPKILRDLNIFAAINISTCPLPLVVLFHKAFDHAKVCSFVFFHLAALSAILHIHADNDKDQRNVEEHEYNQLEVNHAVAIRLVFWLLLHSLRHRENLTYSWSRACRC